MNAFYLPAFKSKALWQQAVTHKSHAKEQAQPGQDNERLEFLGDAILTFLSGQYLYQRYPERSEGELTPLRAALVDEKQLSHFAKRLNLQTHLRLSLGAENSGGRQSKRLLCSAFEAIVGAYFLDTGSDIQAVRDYVWPMFDAVAQQVDQTALQVNFKSRLQAWALEATGEVPQYIIIHETGPDHAKAFTAEVRIQGKAYGQGSGRKKQDAEKQAAQAALEALKP
ncbi:MAG: ribonuclease III [Leptolyngbya sp. SIO4C1]|nr:ribonuclease III [Leptolyngbya sp. SIO4C1]